ncbi:MAG: hypothetical protein AAB588_03310 [Patescibacteria group bacterium]
MIKTVRGKLENGKIIPLQKIKNTSGYQIYITLVPLETKEGLTEAEFLKSARQADQLFKKGNLHEVHSLSELD